MSRERHLEPQNVIAIGFPQPVRSALDVPSIVNSFAHRMMYSVGNDKYTATEFNYYQALAYAVRDRLMERWFETQRSYYRNDVKRVYYLSLEFLMGRALGNNILNLGSVENFRQAMEEVGYPLKRIEEREPDAGLGNGGLGRLAACFLDSAATLGLPLYGYGIRYEYGIFRQNIHDGYQVEGPDNWLRYGNPWEIARPEVLFPVQFYGRIRHYRDDEGHDRIDWVDTEDLYAMAYDVPIIGFRNDCVNTLRLWSAKSTREFDLAQFNSGDYMKAVEDKNQTENIAKVLYPSDAKYVGKELRLKQQYFFVAATLQDLLRRFRKSGERRWEELPDKVAVQLNDTHPAIAIPELMRILVDKEHLAWDQAWEVTRGIFGFTNHTVLPEALESWSEEMLGRLLPRHLQLIHEIDRRHRLDVGRRFPDEPEMVARTAIVDDHAGRMIRMANLAIVGSHSVNGVAAIHTQILKDSFFRDFHRLYPGRFNNKTNGITPRRWLLKANEALTSLICEAIGDEWTGDFDRLQELATFATDAAFQQKWAAVRRSNKERFSHWLTRTTRRPQTIDSASMYDVQVKRIHEYKRQLLNAMHVIDLFHRVREGESLEAPRTVIFGGKAAPSYLMAKLIIKLINSIGEMVEREPRTRGLLKVLFLPNYGVSCAEQIMPACDLSEQISTAGTEASGTGNMKAALNGAITIGTLDGANVEIRDHVGEENILIFGHTVDQIERLKREHVTAETFIERSERLQQVFATLASRELEQGSAGLFQPVIEMLRHTDRYFHCADFEPYVQMQEEASQLYTNQSEWLRKSILNVAGMGFFSSDRTIREYARDVWHLPAG
jgi:glycogen phosphorylase